MQFGNNDQTLYFASAVIVVAAIAIYLIQMPAEQVEQVSPPSSASNWSNGSNGIAKTGEPIQIQSAADFAQYQQDKLVIFVSDQCPACVGFKPHIPEIAAKISQPVLVINPGDNPELAQRFNLQYIPSLFRVRDSIEEFKGEPTVDTIVAFMGN